jgi:hypothetical protein
MIQIAFCTKRRDITNVGRICRVLGKYFSVLPGGKPSSFCSVAPLAMRTLPPSLSAVPYAIRSPILNRATPCSEGSPSIYQSCSRRFCAALQKRGMKSDFGILPIHRFAFSEVPGGSPHYPSTAPPVLDILNCDSVYMCSHLRIVARRMADTSMLGRTGLQDARKISC